MLSARDALMERLAQRIHMETCPDWSWTCSLRPADFAAAAAVLQLLATEGHLQEPQSAGDTPASIHPPRKATPMTDPTPVREDTGTDTAAPEIVLGAMYVDSTTGFTGVATGAATYLAEAVEVRLERLTADGERLTDWFEVSRIKAAE